MTAQTVWPEGVIARYLTVAGATVDLTGNVSFMSYRCTGCTEGSSGWSEDVARRYAQGHAETCRAMPRPTA